MFKNRWLGTPPVLVMPLRAIKTAVFVVAVAHNHIKSKDVLRRLCSANWFGSINSVFRGGGAPNALGCSILREHPSANRSMK